MQFLHNNRQSKYQYRPTLVMYMQKFQQEKFRGCGSKHVLYGNFQIYKYFIHSFYKTTITVKLSSLKTFHIYGRAYDNSQSPDIFQPKQPSVQFGQTNLIYVINGNFIGEDNECLDNFQSLS